MEAAQSKLIINFGHPQKINSTFKYSLVTPSIPPECLYLVP